MNLHSNTNDEGQSIKRTAPISIEDEEDIKPNKRQLDAQKLIQLEHTRSQVTISHHTYPEVTSAQQNHMQLPTNRQNHLQMTTNTQSSTVIQNPPSHSPMTIVSQNHPHMMTGQLNHQVTVSQHNYLKTGNTGRPNPFQVPTSQPNHQMTASQNNLQNITVGHSNPHQMNTGQPMITDQQSQPQISTGHQRCEQLSPVQMRFLETSPTRPNHTEGVTGQQKSESLPESL